MLKSEAGIGAVIVIDGGGILKCDGGVAFGWARVLTCMSSRVQSSFSRSFSHPPSSQPILETVVTCLVKGGGRLDNDARPPCFPVVAEGSVDYLCMLL